MGFFKFIFVLLIVLPIAVLMIYFVNNLSEKVNVMIKKDKEAERGEDGYANGKRNSRTARNGRSYRETKRKHITERFDENSEGHENGDAGYSPARGNSGDKRSGTGSASKRKRRKERKKKRNEKRTEANGREAGKH